MKKKSLFWQIKNDCLVIWACSISLLILICFQSKLVIQIEMGAERSSWNWTNMQNTPKHNFPLNYSLWKGNSLFTIRWTARHVRCKSAIDHQSHLNAARPLSIQLSIDNWILISRLPHTHILFDTYSNIFFSYFFDRHFHNVNISSIECAMYTKLLDVYEREKITHCQWNQIKSNQIRAQPMKVDIQWKLKKNTKISFCDVTFVAQILANLLALDHD